MFADAEVVAAAEQLEARDFEQYGGPLGAPGREGTETAAAEGDDPDPNRDTQLPMRVLMPHHILEAAKSLPPL